MWANATVPKSLQLPHERVGRDQDSVGLFQQRGVGWGSLGERMDPRRSAELFYAALLATPDWDTLPLTVAAQRVQRSATPNAYARWEPDARGLVAAALGIDCPPDPGQPTTDGAAVDNVAFTLPADPLPEPGELLPYTAFDLTQPDRRRRATVLHDR